jgi:hypothetical protein
MLSLLASGQSLGAFERLLLLRAVRPDRVLSALRTFVSHSLGPQYVRSPVC